MDIRPIRDDELPVFHQTIVTTFGGDPAADPQGAERLRALLESGRSFGAFDRGRMVATAAGFDFSLTVEGGAIPMSGLTMVAVLPTHRRRGILRGLIAAHLEEAGGRGVPASGLWASESSIYGRFGYGIAAEGDDLAFSAPGLQLRTGALDDVEPLSEPDPEILPRLYDEVRAARPGMLTRSPAWWRHRLFHDRPDVARGASPRRHALARRAGVPTGYVTYRQRSRWEQGIAQGAVEVQELVATDARAEATLWRLITTVDLFPHVSWWNAPVDTILPWIVSDPRRLRRRRSDTLWLRLEDVPAALAARRYAADGLLRLRVVDPPSTEGRVYELRVDGGVARCDPAGGGADLQLDRAALGSLYLGAFRAPLLARAGRAAGEPATLALADRMFTSSAAPWCAEIF
jgi:predicted acetyltransferase